MPQHEDYEDREFLAEMLLRDLGCMEPLEDDLDDFLREIYDDLGYDDEELAEMLEEWEDEDV